MRIGAYQFGVTKNIKQNLDIIKKAILQAVEKDVKLLVFPECALTGYPPRDLEQASAVQLDELELAYQQIQSMVDENEIYVILGTITKQGDHYYNSAMVLAPYGEASFYHKRALWGWDQDNFSTGNQIGIYKIAGLKVGVRICFEVRFPEFFRELYKERTDLNLILFYDVSDYDDTERYELIKSHIRTRAVENVTCTLSVDTIRPYQTAPTALYDQSGCTLMELKRNEESLLVYDFENTEPDFGEQGRLEISDWLMAGQNTKQSVSQLPKYQHVRKDI